MTSLQDQTSSPAIIDLTTPPPALRRVVLTGFMGAGKSTLGRLLADHLGWNFLDLDTAIEARAGASIPEIFQAQGETRFRRLESTALASALRSSPNVLALGGGALESLTNRLLLEQTPGNLVVFLDAPFSTLFDRCVLQGIDRPNLADPAAARTRFDQRHTFYRRLARLTLSTADLTPRETLERLLPSILDANLLP